MRFSTGDVVRSTAGRDKGHLYVVVGTTVNRIMVANGRKRTVSAPKVKNHNHLQRVGGMDTVITDEEIRQFLQKVNCTADEREGN